MAHICAKCCSTVALQLRVKCSLILQGPITVRKNVPLKGPIAVRSLKGFLQLSLARFFSWELLVVSALACDCEHCTGSPFILNQLEDPINNVFNFHDAKRIRCSLKAV
eukprot:Colp12_sorted_trinity150504_noHs@11788